MIRDTSIQTYREITENGLLSKRRFDVYDVLFHHGPLTQTEVHAIVAKNTKISIRSITPRFSELERMGVIREVDRKICSVTGRQCIRWDVTSKLPIKFDKPIEHTCPTCHGKGKIVSSQGRLF